MEKVQYCGSCLLRSCKPLNAKGRSNFIKLTRVPIIYRGISYSRFPLLKFAKTGFGKGINARVQVEVDEETMDHLQEKKLKYQQHPGTFNVSRAALPEKFFNAVEQLSSYENRRKLAEEGQKLRNYLWSRHPPMEQGAYRATVSKVESQIKMKEDVLLPFLSEEETVKLENKRDNKILNRLRKEVYHWVPIRYTKQRIWEYIFGRSAGDYAAVYRIFNEIAKRDPEFKPKTLCDFGSGIGTVSWAAREYWSSSLVEHLCADVSWEMNDLAELIFRGGCRNNDHGIPALFFRNHLPESYKVRYDLVVSAFSLLELPSAKDRLETIDKLWKKTEEYLVIVEPGTVAGFKVVQEARDYILGMGLEAKYRPQCFVFSPCPHKMECPRLQFDTIPCNFEVKYRALYPFHHDTTWSDRISYVVIRRGYPSPDEKMWPRLVESPLIRPRHIICRICTKKGELSEFVLTKAKHSLNDRLIAKRSKWGDLLPIHIKQEDDTSRKDDGQNKNNDN